ncbi:MAG: hypothetical protein AB7S48_01100 [Bacteroidales bacterium]
MSRQEDHIDSIIRRIIFLSLFLLTLLAYKGNYEKYGLFGHSDSIEYTLKANHSATFSFPADFHSPDNSLFSCSLFPSRNFDSINAGLLSVNCSINSLLQTHRERFLRIKPQLLQSELFHIRASLNCDGIALIS